MGYLGGRQVGKTPSSSAKRTIGEARVEREGEDAMRSEGGLKEGERAGDEIRWC